MRELSLDRLRTLVAIADLGSFAAAARALHLAPPTVSLHISELEERIGAPLLLRQRSQVRPSGIGATLVARARQLLAAAEQALEEVGRQVQGLAGRVRLGASTGAIAYLLPQVLERLGQSHPGIDVQIHILTSQETLSQLVEGSLDVGLVALPQSPVGGLTVKPWRRDPVMAFVPAAWHAPRVVTPTWLAAQPLILNAPET
ncbi:LysR family transcriptional regulator, partial [Herbaspirillum sp. B65]|uniref:LysR family transcriptional regulator n=1 Tax=Herbaspirillum sp. B65 TaxID=137708 RepID=UPI0005C8ADCF